MVDTKIQSDPRVWNGLSSRSWVLKARGRIKCTNLLKVYHRTNGGLVLREMFGVGHQIGKVGGRSGCRSTRFQTRAFFTSSKDEPLSLNLDFYKLLHVSRGAGKDTIYKAYERALGPEAPTSGYSDQALQSRKMILDGALETLGTMTIRREYDERVQLGAIEELIPGKHVAGALILLSEANEDQAVIEAGMPWLEQHPRHKCTKDVATVVGYSYFNIARRLIDARESLVDARMLLDQALGVLKRFGGSYGVEKIASQSLEELGPRLALELVSSADQGVKKEGILLLPSALSKLKKESEKDRRSQQTWLSYLDRVRQILTADELIELFNVSENVFTDPREIYYVAVAHIAAACHNIDPKLVSAAKDLLLRAEKLASHQSRRSDNAGDSGVIVVSRKMAEEKQRRLMALACSELLLGDSGAAAEALGLRTDPVTCDRQIYTFIKNNSRGADSLLPGICFLVERWISDVALSSFYRKPDARFSLNFWFETPLVVSYIESMHSKNGLLSGIGNIVGLILSPVKGFFTHNRPDENVAAETKWDSDSDDVSFEEPKPLISETETVIPNISDNAEYESKAELEDSVPETHEEVQELKEEENIRQVPRPTATSSIEEEQINPFAITADTEQVTKSADSELEAMENEYLRGMSESNMNIFDDDDLPKPVDASSISPLGGEEMWFKQAYEARRVRWGRVTGTALLLAVGISASFRYHGAPSFVQNLPIVGFTSTDKALLSKGQAYSLIQRWQKIKADALGRYHRTEGLNQVLGNQLSNEWTARAGELKSKGWHYVHDSHKCKVKSVKRGDQEKTFEVTADINEDVVIYKGGSVSPQRFSSSYTVTYIFDLSGDGWKMTSASVGN
eukprot:jgi/Picsp_1/5222/NSC_02585-R1_protein